jgi:hypothetical protein
MNAWRKYPVIYGTNNTWVWLSELSRKYQKVVDLAMVPTQEWNDIASPPSPNSKLPSLTQIAH